MIKVLALRGSLRKGSFNNALLAVAQELCPAEMVIEVHPPLSDIPPYDDDVRLAGYPSTVQALRGAIAAADAILFASPEFNYGLPGVLKNAIDWVSRPPSQPFGGKPAAVMSGSIGNIGGVRMQHQLRQTAVSVDLAMMPRPEMAVPSIQQKFDAELKLTDEETRKHLTQFLQGFARWVTKIKSQA